ncbi:MFS family permease [Kutzneria viridogrisea]|uniref:MFS family permease n=1 Tax=Kutzneria viridogrisea TaxID=47990 RepID=A0ABR6B9Q5_9PSEU|nr:MFS family permease [Kutzneria viridogrisea]
MPTVRATAMLLFGALGWQVGVWAASLPSLAREQGLDPGALGGRLAALAAASVLGVLAAGRIADRRGRRGVAACGTALLALSYALFLLGPLPLAFSFPAFACYGVATGLVDIAANAVGSDLEAATGRKLMVGLHAGFSGGAAVGAACAVLFGLAGYGHHQLFALTVVLMLAACGFVLVARFPPHLRTPPVAAAGAGRRVSWRGPAVLLIIVVGTVCFFGDGVMQSFAPLYLNQTAGAGVVGAAAGVALFHSASLCGRVAATPMLLRGGNEVAVLVVCATAATLSVGLVAIGSSVWLALIGMALAGLMLSPVIPIAYSLLGRTAGNSAGAALSVLTACSYGAFTAAPAISGVVAETVGLRAVLVLAIACYGCCAVITFFARRRISARAHPDPSLDPSSNPSLSRPA